MTSRIKDLALGYVSAVGKNDFDELGSLFHPDLQFTGPYVTLQGAEAYTQALQRVGAIRSRNDIKKAFVDGNEACIIYDFVTTLASGVVPSVEWLEFDGDRIKSIRLFFDRETFGPARAELARLATASSA